MWSAVTNRVSVVPMTERGTRATAPDEDDDVPHVTPELEALDVLVAPDVLDDELEPPPPLVEVEDELEQAAVMAPPTGRRMQMAVRTRLRVRSTGSR